MQAWLDMWLKIVVSICTCLSSIRLCSRLMRQTHKLVATAADSLPIEPLTNEFWQILQKVEGFPWRFLALINVGQP